MLCGVLSADGAAQEYRDYLLKKVGNLYILHVGADDSVKPYQVYNLFFEDVLRLPFLGFPVKTTRHYFGAVQVTQLFPDYCVVRIVARYMEKEPEGDRIVLVKRELPRELLEKAYAAHGLTMPEAEREKFRASLRREIEEAPRGETISREIETPLKDAAFRPFSFGINYYYAYNQFSKPVTDNLRSVLNDRIYNGGGVYESTFSSIGGIGVRVGKMITPYVMVEGGLAYTSQHADLSSALSDEVTLPPGPISVLSWNFGIDTKVIEWSLSLEVSRFNKALSYFTGESRERAYTPRFALGVNYAGIENELDQRIELYKYTGNEVRTLAEKTSMGGYWGMHAAAGIDYYLQAGKFFVELTYQHWFSDKFSGTLPFRVGAMIFF